MDRLVRHMSRNSLRAALALLCLLALAAGTPARADGIAFVLNSADASISEFDTATLREIRRLPVLREPHHMATTPDGKSLVVGDTAGNAAFFLDAQTGLMQRHVPMSDPYQLQYSPNGKLMTVAGLARDQIDIYDAATLTLQHRIAAPRMPSHINYSPDSAVVYVSLQDTGKLIAIETATGKVLAGPGNKRHGLINRSQKMKRQNRGSQTLTHADGLTVKQWAPYGLG
jgi:DNA-binding beta-propeller fold protein YncE